METISRRSLFGVGVAGATLPLVSRIGLADPVQQPPPIPQPHPIKQPEPKEPPIEIANYPYPMIPDPHNTGPWPILVIQEEYRKKGFGFLPKLYFIRVRQQDFDYSILIEGRQMTLADLDNQRTIDDWYQTLDLVEIPKPTKSNHFNFEINRQMSDIARQSRRGRGNLFLYRQLPAMSCMTPNITFVPMDWTQSYHCDGVLAYRGITIYDRPFVGIKGLSGRPPGQIYWVAHPDYKKYARRYLLV